jgi:hypothetical protein
MPSVVYDGIRLQIPKPSVRETSARRFETVPHIDESGLDASRDLAPARGTVTAVGVGIALWSGILLLVRSVAS